MSDFLSQFAIALGGNALLKVIPALLLAGVCLIAVKVLMKMLDKLLTHLKIPPTLMGMVRSVLKVLLYVFGALIVMGYLGIPVTSLVAAMSVIGVAVSLGVQNFLTNVVGGFQLLGSHPFEVGDFVDAGGCSGTVQEIGLFYTKIVTGDNKIIQMPNSSVVSSNIINYSGAATRRVDLSVKVSYDAPVEQVEQVLLALLAEHEKVLADPAPFARVSGYGNSAIEYAVRAWCATEDYWTVYYDLVKAVKVAFDRNGIPMTYDHLNVHVTKEV